MLKSVITGTGACIPDIVKLNEHFVNQTFYDESGLRVASSSPEIIEKFSKITGIRERRYAPDHLNTSDIAALAATDAIADSGIDPETLDQIIVAHNFGDVAHASSRSQNVPSIASRVKNILKIRRPECIGYDILFGCPGWVQSLIQADAYFKAGMAKKSLLNGAETLSRVVDTSDRDSMIFADGAGASIVEYRETGDDGAGILGSCSQTHSLEEVNYIRMGSAYQPGSETDALFMKMKGRKVYEFALKHVPLAIKSCLEHCAVDIKQISKIFIHQANEKMDEEIISRLYKLYGMNSHPEQIMPMNIQLLGNSSVATVPTLYHMVRKEAIAGHNVSPGNLIIFASVGAGMHINAVCYRV